MKNKEIAINYNKKMKKIIFIVLLLFTIKSNAQIMINQTLYSVKTELKKKGHYIYEDKTKDDTPYIIEVRDELVNIYYFDDNNLCYLQVIKFDGLSLKDIEFLLKEKKYKKISNLNYENQDYYAELIYEESFKQYLVFITAK
jgi:hypothetical protein